MRAVLTLALLFIASSAHASPFQVHVLSASYSTFARLGAVGLGIPITTHSGTDDARPRGDRLDIPPPLDREQGIWAHASADQFAVAVSTGAFLDATSFAIADAVTTLTFQPVETGTADLTLEAFAGQKAFGFSTVAASVTDLTTHAVVWALTWNSRFEDVGQPGVLPWQWMFSDQTVAVPLTTLFAADHLYQLVLSAHTGAAADREVVTLSVTGLRTVPEPTGLILLGTAASVAAYTRRRLTGRSPSRP